MNNENIVIMKHLLWKIQIEKNSEKLPITYFLEIKMNSFTIDF